MLHDELLEFNSALFKPRKRKGLEKARRNKHEDNNKRNRI